MRHHEEYLTREKNHGPIAGKEVSPYLTEFFDDEIATGDLPDYDIYMYLSTRLTDEKAVFAFLSAWIGRCVDGRQLGYASVFLSIYQDLQEKVDVELLIRLHKACAGSAYVRHICPEGMVAAVCSGFMKTRDERLKKLVEGFRPIRKIIRESINSRESYELALQVIEMSE